MPREARQFNFRRRSAESVQKRANMRAGGFSTLFKSEFKVYKIKDGKNIIRILPPTWDDAEHYAYDIFVNYNIGADNQSFLSISKMKGEKDPLAEAKREAERRGDKKLAKALNPVQRELMWVIDRQDEDEGPQLFNCPFTLDKSFANKAYDEDTREVIYPDDPNEGCDIRFYKEGKNLNTDYDASKIKFFDPTPLSDDPALAEEWMEFVEKNPIPSVLNFYDYEHISETFNGMAGRREDDDDGDDKPPQRRSRDHDDNERPTKERKPPWKDDDDEDDKKGSPDNDDSSEPDKAEQEVRPSLKERLQQRRRRIDEDAD